jgi:hypothetical protein
VRPVRSVLSFPGRMKGLCSVCGQPVEVVDFRLDEGVVQVRCTACGKEQRLTVSAATGAEEESAPPPPLSGPAQAVSAERPAAPLPQAGVPLFEPPTGFCPKCVAPKSPSATACPACGLVFSNYQPGELQPSATLAAAWTALAAEWPSAAAHARFLQLAAAEDALPSAGRLYRLRLAQAPEDARAKAGVEATVKMASAAVAVAAVAKAPVVGALPRRRAKVVLAVLVFFGPMTAFLLLRLLLGGH